MFILHQVYLNKYFELNIDYYFLIFLVVNRGNEIFQLLKETKERVKHGTRMLNY